MGKRFKLSDIPKSKQPNGIKFESDLELALLRDIKVCGLPCPVREYHLFAEIVGKGKGVRERLQGRGWKDYRYDFAWPEYKFCVECNGQIHKVGGHSSFKGLMRDYEKGFNAAELGWTVASYAAKHIKSGTAIRSIERILKLKGWQP